MASPIGYQLCLEDADFVDTWQRCFSARARTKKLKDDKEKEGENGITYLFLAIAGREVTDESLHHDVYHKPGGPDF